MKKKCIIFICGIIINNKKPYDSIFNNLIKPNSDKFEFKIIVNTSNKYKKTKKWNENKIIEIDRYSHEKKLNELINININKDLEYIVNNLIIEYIDIPNYFSDNGLGSHIPWYRLNEIFKKDKYYNYDFYIYTRPDLVITKIINLNDHINNFSIVTNSKKGGGGFIHNRDWDLMFMGNEFLFKIFIYSIINHLLNILNQDNKVKNIITKDKYFNQYYLKDIYKKIGFIPDIIKNHRFISILEYMYDNGYKAHVLDDNQIFVNIIRDSSIFPKIQKNKNSLNFFIILIIFILLLYLWKLSYL